MESQITERFNEHARRVDVRILLGENMITAQSTKWNVELSNYQKMVDKDNIAANIRTCKTDGCGRSVGREHDYCREHRI